MFITRSQVIEMLTARGDVATAAQAERSLPVRLDTDHDRSLLDRFGVDVHDLLGRLSGLGS